ncbi:MAG: hypothetical protein ACO3XO_05470 [Bdellovibrionota bacterium]|jgi:hypothetical protein
MSESELLNAAVAEKDGGRIGTAFEFLLQFLRCNPMDPRGRLLLAELFYRGGSPELAVEEVTKLTKRIPESESLSRLLKALDPLSKDGERLLREDSTEQSRELGEKEVLAEVEFDLDDIELLEK